MTLPPYVQKGAYGSAANPLMAVSGYSAPVALTPSDSATFAQLKIGFHIRVTTPGSVKVGWPNGLTELIFFDTVGDYDRSYFINQIFVTGGTAVFTNTFGQ